MSAQISFPIVEGNKTRKNNSIPQGSPNTRPKKFPTSQNGYSTAPSENGTVTYLQLALATVEAKEEIDRIESKTIGGEDGNFGCPSGVQSKQLRTTPPRYWTPEENLKFLHFIGKLGMMDYERISAEVGTRSVSQVKTHYQSLVRKFDKAARARAILAKGNEPAPSAVETLSVEYRLGLPLHFNLALLGEVCKELLKEYHKTSTNSRKRSGGGKSLKKSNATEKRQKIIAPEGGIRKLSAVEGKQSVAERKNAEVIQDYETGESSDINRNNRLAENLAGEFGQLRIDVDIPSTEVRPLERRQ